MAEVKIAADSGGGSVGLVGPASTTGNVARQITLPDVANGTLRTTTTPGAILQVVSTTSSTNDSTTDNWDQTNDKGTNIGPTLSITPSSTSSKIIVFSKEIPEYLTVISEATRIINPNRK